MKISLKYLNQNFNLDLASDVSQVVERIGARLGEVEDVVLDLAEVYKSVIIAKVVSLEPIEGSDHLNHCLIDDGNSAKDVARNDQGLVEVVCGAPNVVAEQLVAWLPPGSVVPSSYSKDTFTLSVRSMLGKTSNGMLASAKELAITDSHAGILIIDKPAKPGDSFMQLYQLDDQIINIENKMFTHRPDCFGLLGVAREVAGIFNKPFKTPEWYLNAQSIKPEADQLVFSLSNQLPELVPRFCAVAISNIEVTASPLQLQSYLSRMGIRPVNNIVDATNFVMLLTGQPLHAYDYDKLRQIAGGNEPEIVVRKPKKGEVIKLINGKSVEPKPENILISANDTAVGIAGVMGSANSEVDESTKNIVLEAACFDMYSIRRASMELGVFSEAVTRFSKGQSPLACDRALTKAVELIKELVSSATVASELLDDNHLSQTIKKANSLYEPVGISADYVNQRLGSELSLEQMKTLLENVEFEVSSEADQLLVKAPFWRTDIEIKEDLVEEIGRLYGYENIKPSPLTRLVTPLQSNRLLDLKTKLRQQLLRAGANEFLCYSFVSKKLLSSANQDQAKAYEIANSLSPELNFYRLSLTPSLLYKVHQNIKSGYDQFALFELGVKHQVDWLEDNLPNELQSLSFVYASRSSAKEAAYYRAKTYLDFLFDLNGIDSVSFRPLNNAQIQVDARLAETTKPFDQNRSALIVDKDGRQWGIVGEYQQSVKTNFKLPTDVSGFELDPAIFELETVTKYQRASKYPSVKQDMTLGFKTTVNYRQIADFLTLKLNELKTDSMIYQLQPLSIFSPDGSDQINYSFRLVITDYNQTLSDQQVNKLLEEIAQDASGEFQAVRI